MKRVLAIVLGAAGLAMTSYAQANDASPCARTMVRQTYDYLTPAPRERDPRSTLPPALSVDERRALHTVLWPSEFSARMSVLHWLKERNFDCIEEAFADLEAVQARFAHGPRKVGAMLGAAYDLVAHERGMSAAEIDAFVKPWRERHPSSVLAEVMGARLLNAAAWHLRGGGYTADVSPERLRGFRQLVDAAQIQVRGWRPQTRQHLLGQLVALRVLRDGDLGREAAQRMALDGLARHPEEGILVSLAAERLLPQWGGSPALMERFAAEALRASGPLWGPAMYATIYVELVGLDKLHTYPAAQLGVIRTGLMTQARGQGFEAIARLQEFGCTVRDTEAFRESQARWAAYAREPQLQAPRQDLNATCREWAQGLPPTAAAAPAMPPAPAAAPRAPALAADTSVYRVANGPWERMTTPVGEVFSCTACEYPVQMLVAAGAPQALGLSAVTHDDFVALLRTPEARQRMARSLVEVSAQLDTARGGYELEITQAALEPFAGLVAFRSESALKRGPRTFNEIAYVVIHHGKLLRVSVNRMAGPVGAKERDAVAAFLAGFTLVTP